MCSILPPRYHRNGRMHYDQKYPVLLLFSAYSIPIPQDLIEICYSPLIFFNKFNFLSRNFLGLLKSWDLIEIFLKPTLKPFEHHPPPSWTPPPPPCRHRNTFFMLIWKNRLPDTLSWTRSKFRYIVYDCLTIHNVIYYSYCRILSVLLSYYS